MGQVDEENVVEVVVRRGKISKELYLRCQRWCGERER